MPYLRRGRASASVALFAVVLLLVTGLAATADDRPGKPEAKIAAPLLDGLEEGGRDDYVIEFAETADLSSAAEIEGWEEKGRAVVDELRRTATESQADVVAALDAGGVEYQSFWIDNTVHVEGGSEQLALRVAAEGEVIAVREPDEVALEQPEKSARRSAVAGVEWGVADIHADQVWEQFGARGEGLVVANIDSGVQYDHPALVASYRGNQGGGSFDHNYNWWDPTGLCSANGSAPCDTVDHGTHTMGTMVGDGGEGARIGVAPGARWIAAKGCEQLGCSELGLTSAAQWVLAPTDLAGANPEPSRRPHIVNNSWSGAGNDDWYEDFVDAWVASGIFPVFSNGNTGPECETTGAPGEYAASYSVGNYAPDGKIAPSSSRGPGPGEVTKPDISAPGTAVRSSVPGGEYKIFSGTSMAAPHLAGTVALLWSAAPSLVGDVSGTRLLLDDTARDVADDQCGGDEDDNNVYGEGRLDALAVVEAAPHGPTGRLTGRVLDAESGEPVADAQLRLTGPTDRAAVTDHTGEYAVALNPGNYRVDVSRFGYDDVTTTVQIRAGDILQKDLELVESPRVRVRGRVTDGSGQGWPLYARVDLPGTPVRTFSDPETGRYELTVPAGHSYRLRTAARYPGYRTHVEDLTVDGPMTHDVGVPVDPTTCTAPGYERPGGLTEDFESSRTTDRWSVEDLADNGQTWTFGDIGGRGNLTGGTGRFAIVDSDHYGRDGTQNTALVSPSVDLGDVEEPVLEFATEFRRYWSTSAEVDVSVDGGETWSNVWRDFDGQAGPDTIRLSVPAAAGEDDVRMRFHYLRASDDWWWQVDNVFLGERNCVPADGGLVVGHTRSTVTRKPLVGVEVKSARSPLTATSVGTPDDAATPDGLYWLFAPAAGRHQLTATLAGHTDARAQVQVADGQTVRHDLGLESGRLEPVPHSLTVEIQAGKVAQRRLTLANTGDASLRYDLEEVPGRPVTSSESGSGWGRITPYPSPVSDSAAGILGGTIYSFGGVGAGERARADGYRYDEEAQEWVRLADLPIAHRKPAGGFVNGRFVLTGGWDKDDQLTDATSIYDPGSDTWSEGAPNPQPWAAAGSAVLEGQLYVVGGCDAQGDCGQADVLRYDPAADEWSRAADYPQPVAWVACGAIGDRIYCAGGFGPEGDRLAAYAYDAGRNEWTPVADMPIDLWGSASSVSGDRLVMVGGITNKGSELTSESLAYDPVEDTWSQLPTPPYTFYRSTGVCGFTRIGGADNRAWGVTEVARLPMAGDCGQARDQAWLRTVRSGTVPADRSRGLTLKFDARKVPGPGVYDAYLRFTEDTPYPTAPVRVRLVVRR
ncbi:MAG TPA: S8 family serine peptidase [Nocardioides sp.]|nr:S8 family serine peptidase [Nocardioides sp.]